MRKMIRISALLLVMSAVISCGFASRRSNITFDVEGVRLIDMVYVEGGEFTMGATLKQIMEAFGDEKQVHKVKLSGFYISKYEVTQLLWTYVMGENPSCFKGEDNLPVERVSWNDCQVFIVKLNEMTGRNFRLPTEAEWEYAARGGKKSKGYKYSGSDDLDEVAWYGEGWNCWTHPVGQKKPNELGIYDMSGNVSELCQDSFGFYTSDAQTDPAGPADPCILLDTYRVKRGGSVFDKAPRCLSSSRGMELQDCGLNTIGLRLALSE